MAYSGSGTQADPYIVDNWADFLTVENLRYDTYIKWADKDNPNDKVVPPITINTRTDWKAAEVDFNGWTFEQIYIDAAYPTVRLIYLLAFADTKIYNWHIVNLIFKDCQVNFIDSLTDMYNCYFDNVICEPQSSTSAYWTYQGLGNEIFRYCNFYYSVINTYTEECNMVIPGGQYYNSEIYVHYKYTGDTAIKSRNSIFINEIGLHNSFMGGVIDVSEGSGSFAITDPHRDVIHGGQYPSGMRYENALINIKFKVSDTCTISAYDSNTTFYRLPNDSRTLFVTNNGNNHSGLTTIPTNMRCAEGDIKNKDLLISSNFQFTADDGTRYPQYALDNPSQTWGWHQITQVNNGVPFNPLWFYPVFVPPEYSGDVDENPYITVYDMETKQDKFTGHGLAVLRPTSCRIVEELNGEYNLSLTHPRDAEGKWQYLLEFNIIKALGQLFVIQKVDEIQQGGTAYVQVYAEHITYILNDKWIFPPFTISGYVGQTLIDEIMALATDMGGEWQVQYGFDITSDLNADENFRDWYDMKEGKTPYEMLIGSNGFVSKIGGEMYRDNFTVKINERMYGAQDNAFEMAVGYNLTGIVRTVDLTTFCTYFRGYNVSDPETAYQEWFAVSWDASTLPRAYPRNVVRSQNFAYDLESEYNEGRLERDTMNFFNQNCSPLISYELTLKDLKRNPDYKMFTNNYRYKVGDKGKVWDERLQSWVELEITHTEKDGITGECTKVVIGTQRSFTRPSGYIPTIPRGIIIPNAEMIIEGVPPLEFSSNGDNLLEWYIHGATGGVGGTGNNKFYGGLQVQMYNPSNGQPISGMTSWVSSYSLIPVEPDTEYTFSPQRRPDETMGFFTIEFDENENFVTSGSTNTSSEVNCRTWTTSSTTKYVRFEITGSSRYYYPSDYGDFNLNLGGTQLPYEPYSLCVPVTISDGTNSQTINIPINHPLTENETISRTSTNVDIPTYQGDNTLTVNTETQPSLVKIKFKENT